MEVLIWFILAVLTLRLAYQWGFFNFTRSSLPASSLNFGDVLAAFIIFLAIQLVLAPLAISAYSYFFKGVFIKSFNELDKKTQALFPIFVEVLLIIGFGGYCYLQKEKVKQFFRSGWKLTDFGFGVLTWFIAIPVATFFSESFDFILQHFRGAVPVEQLVVEQLKSLLAFPTIFLVTAFFISVATPVLEELLFRGFLQTWLKSHLGIKGAILLTSLIFAFFHFSLSQGWGNLTIITILFILSCFMGYIYERQQSLLAPIGLHTAFNSVTIVIIFLSDYLSFSLER